MGVEIPEAPARLLVVDDHPVVRLGIRQMISAESDLVICGEADSASAALEAAKALKPDLAIVDLSLPDTAGVELIRELHDSAPEMKLLVLSMHDEAFFADRALRAGARGYIMKQEATSDLVHAIRQVLEGRVYVSERLSQNLLEQLGRDANPPAGWLTQLTDRELEVFELIGRGLSTIAIAERLDVSVKTVETYRANIKVKLDIKDAANLIRYAVRWIERI